MKRSELQVSRANWLVSKAVTEYRCTGAPRQYQLIHMPHWHARTKHLVGRPGIPNTDPDWQTSEPCPDTESQQCIKNEYGRL